MPVGDAGPPTGAAAAWLPFVGAVIGALSGAAALLVARASPALGVATAFGLSLVLSGAIHLDGFADSCDALFANVGVERRLEIFRDPRHGTFALAGCAVAVVVWVAALASIAPVHYPALLAQVGAAARWGAVVHLLSAPHARPGDRSPAFAQRPPATVLLVELLLLIAAATFFVAPRSGALAATIVAFVAATAAVTFARRRLAGAVVGDVYGFAIVAAEVAGPVAYALTAR